MTQFFIGIIVIVVFLVGFIMAIARVIDWTDDLIRRMQFKSDQEESKDEDIKNGS